jgi:hypothetical protein
MGEPDAGGFTAPGSEHHAIGSFDPGKARSLFPERFSTCN